MTRRRMTTRYFDANVVPVGATGVAPAGPSAGLPYDATNAPAGPPPGYAGPAPSAPMMVGPASASTKKSDDDDERMEPLALGARLHLEGVQEGDRLGPRPEAGPRGLRPGPGPVQREELRRSGQGILYGLVALARLDHGRRRHVSRGRIVLLRGPLRQAQDSYVNLLKKHDNTRYLDTVVARLFAIATYWEQLDLQSHHWPVTPNATDKTQPWFDTFGNALACYQAVWLHDPTGPLADAALFRVANAHFRRGEWEDAAAALRHAAKEPSQEQVPEGRAPAGTAGENADLPGPQVLDRAAERRPGDCGTCGRKLAVFYRGPAKTVPNYYCQESPSWSTAGGPGT